MLIKVKMPVLGDMTQAVLVREWISQVGDRVAEGSPLMLVETDKVDAEVPSPAAGVVAEHLVSPEDEVETGAFICVIDSSG